MFPRRPSHSCRAHDESSPAKCVPDRSLRRRRTTEPTSSSQRRASTWSRGRIQREAVALLAVVACAVAAPDERHGCAFVCTARAHEPLVAVTALQTRPVECPASVVTAPSSGRSDDVHKTMKGAHQNALDVSTAFRDVYPAFGNVRKRPLPRNSSRPSRALSTMFYWGRWVSRHTAIQFETSLRSVDAERLLSRRSPLSRSPQLASCTYGRAPRSGPGHPSRQLRRPAPTR